VETKKLNNYKEKLLKEKKRLEQELKKMHEENYQTALGQREMGSDENFEDHIGDAASNIFDRERDLSLEQNTKDLLNQVVEALNRLEKGQYGICARCHKPIDEARLKAIPYAELCIECKQKEEELA
jgi:RNA polymerase-binding protein DksA